MTRAQAEDLIRRLYDKAFNFHGDPILDEAAAALEELLAKVVELEEGS